MVVRERPLNAVRHRRTHLLRDSFDMMCWSCSLRVYTRRAASGDVTVRPLRLCQRELGRSARMISTTSPEIASLYRDPLRLLPSRIAGNALHMAPQNPNKASIHNPTSSADAVPPR